MLVPNYIMDGWDAATGDFKVEEKGIVTTSNMKENIPTKLNTPRLAVHLYGLEPREMNTRTSFGLCL